MSKKIAVTGGSGKLGPACIDALLDDGWTFKDLEEETAVQFCRWDPEQKMIGLRFWACPTQQGDVDRRPARRRRTGAPWRSGGL